MEYYENLRVILTGKWDIFYDEKKEGAEYYKGPESLKYVSFQSIDVPGCYEKLKVSKLFTGPVWYGKDFLLPETSHKGSRWILKFEAVSYFCEVYLNGIYIGSHEGMWDKFDFDVTDAAKNGQMNRVEVRVIKPGYRESDRFYVRNVLSGFIPDVGYIFGGIWGRVSIEEEGEAYIDSAYVIPDVDDGCIEAFIGIKNTVNRSIDVCVCISIGDNPCAAEKARLEPEKNNDLRIRVKIQNPILWNMDNPYLYTANIELKKDGLVLSCCRRRFGMRKIAPCGNKLMLNGEPIYIRGLLHWGYYPEKIIPAASDEEIRSEIEGAKRLGFNAIKHCLYIPSERYYEIADEMGMLLWQEMPLWLPENGSLITDRIRQEYPRILKQIAGHPSIIICTLGCELDDTIKEETLEYLYNLVKEWSGDVLVRDNSGSGECYGGLLKDFADFYDYHFYADPQNMEDLLDTFTAGWRKERAWLFGEFCDADTYRDISVLEDKIPGQKLWWTSADTDENPIGLLKPDFCISNQKEVLRENGLSGKNNELYKNSINHAVLHRKITLELSRRFPEITGYNITAIRDVPIATSGIFDDEMIPKFSPEDFISFNSDIVLIPAWDLMREWDCGDRVLKNDHYNYFEGDSFNMHVVVSNYSHNIIDHPEIKWELIDEKGNVVLAGIEISENSFAMGVVSEIGCIRFKVPRVSNPCAFSLDVEMRCKDMKISNSWVLFAYPKNLMKGNGRSICICDYSGRLSPLKEMYNIGYCSGFENEFGSILITSQITPNIERYIEEGGRVFYFQQYDGYLPIKKGPFFRESMLYCTGHKILEHMPKSRFWELEYYGMASDISIDTQQIKNTKISEVKPVLRRIDNRKYDVSDYIAEMNIGHGKLVATTLRLSGGMGKEPGSINKNTAAIYLIDRVLRYLCG